MIELPDLDDRTFTDLTAEARALIPSLAPGWTDHNPTDPGIVLVELFAWLAEIVLYRLDRVPDRSYRTFLQLLRGPDPIAPQPGGGAPPSLDEALRATLAELRERHRAVTSDDFEHLALHRWRTLPGTEAMGISGVVRRAHCIPEQSPATLTQPDQRAEGHYTLVLVPDPPSSPAAPALLEGLRAFLDERRLLTTKVHVIDHRRLPVKVRATLYLRSDGDPDVVHELARNAVERFLDPLHGWRGAGWPFGRAVYASDIHAIFDNLPGVDFVGSVELTSSGERERPPAPQDAPGIALHPHELPVFGGNDFQLFHRVGTRWELT